MKGINIGLLAAIIIAMASAYFLEANMRARIAHMHMLKEAIAYEQETIQFLKVEWSFLNTPQRLENIAEEYLHLKPTNKNNIIHEKDIINKFPLRDPFRPIYGKTDTNSYR